MPQTPRTPTGVKDAMATQLMDMILQMQGQMQTMQREFLHSQDQEQLMERSSRGKGPGSKSKRKRRPDDEAAEEPQQPETLPDVEETQPVEVSSAQEDHVQEEARPKNQKIKKKGRTFRTENGKFLYVKADIH